jgi:DNA processing protein
MALACVVDCGHPVVTELAAASGSEACWDAVSEGAFGDPLAERARRLDIAAVERQTRNVGARFLIPADDEWPSQIDDLRRCPALQRRGGVPVGLWVRGPRRLTETALRAVAVVGARAATDYGVNMATDFSAELAENGVTVVSGGAYGIDAAAHRGALAVHGATVAVLASGLDVPYPKGNARLFEWIGKEHLVVSELPPGATPTRVRFLARNRLIAALSRGTVVVEAALRSGARNTASWTLGLGRTLMAAPGPIHSTMSAAPHLMIREGQASLVTSAGDIMELVSPMGENLVPYPHGEERPTDFWPPQRLAVFEALPARGPASPGEIALTAGVTLPACMAELSALEEVGVVTADERGWRLAPRTVARGRSEEESR